MAGQLPVREGSPSPVSLSRVTALVRLESAVLATAHALSLVTLPEAAVILLRVLQGIQAESSAGMVRP